MDEQKKSTMNLADTYMFQTYGRFPLVLIRGEGCRVWDEEGREYIDFVGGIAVCALGHSSPLVTKALEEQSRRLVHVSNLYYTRPQMELAKILVDNSFADRAFFCNSGAEANEAAIKLARKYSHEKGGGDRNVIITMQNSFHGRTMATLSATGQDKIKKGYNPLLTGFKFVPFNDLKSLEDAIDDNVCAVMLEPIQGEGGVVCPQEGYLNGVRDICDRRNLVMIFDEVQTGMGRTGKLFAYEHFGVNPDIMTLAKALGNGLPIGAMLAKEKFSVAFGPGSHATTFGGTPLVTSVARAVVKSILEDGVLDNCREMGVYLLEKLKDLQRKYTAVKDVRGFGLIVGMELDREGNTVVKECMARGFLINCAQEKVLRFIPPLIVGKKEIDLMTAALDDVLESLQY
ncbi:MAG: acetylornithine transaminase [Deltaproteobacteria bacterium]|nr:acetylornithine transaminase [Deltaproteobacteria bacterium]